MAMYRFGCCKVLQGPKHSKVNRPKKRLQMYYFCFGLNNIEIFVFEELE
jgi:hypothetical protein